MVKWEKKALKNLVDSHLTQQLIPLRSYSRNKLKIVLWSLAFASLIVGLSNPQIGSKMQEVKREGIDIIVALDLSNSMLAEDLSPNRLERSKRAIHQFIDNLKSDRLGLIVFGGQAYVQLPITTDYAAAKLFLSTVNTGIIPTQGTAIGAAIDLAIESFDMESTTNKSIIVISDGENHEDDAMEAANSAAELEVVVHTIGVGSPQGAPIPIYRGKQQNGYRKDKEGNTIMTKLNEVMLQEIAMNGKGVYVHASNAQGGLDQILDEINKMEKVEFGSKIYTDYEDRFQYFIGFSILFLFIEQIISSRKSKVFTTEKLFKTS